MSRVFFRPCQIIRLARGTTAAHICVLYSSKTCRVGDALVNHLLFLSLITEKNNIIPSLNYTIFVVSLCLQLKDKLSKEGCGQKHVCLRREVDLNHLNKTGIKSFLTTRIIIPLQFRGMLGTSRKKGLWIHTNQRTRTHAHIHISASLPSFPT